MTIPTTSATVHTEPVAITADRAKRTFLREFDNWRRFSDGVPSGMVLTVSPILAAHLLATMAHNRTARRGHVRKLAKDMVAGKFTLNGQTIVIDCNGNMIDGWHRCTAIIESGVAVEIIVVIGVDPATMPTLDTGKVRTQTDRMVIDGLDFGFNNRAMGALAKCLILLGRGFRDETLFTGSSMGDGPTARLRDISAEEMKQFILDHEDEMLPALELCRKLCIRLKLRPVTVGLALVLCARVDQPRAYQLVKDIAEKAVLPMTPERALLTRYEKHASRAYLLTPFQQMRLFIRAFNGVGAGERPDRYVTESGGQSRSPGPLGWLDPV